MAWERLRDPGKLQSCEDCIPGKQGSEDMSIFPDKYMVGPWSFQMFSSKNQQGTHVTLSPDATLEGQFTKGKKDALT